MEHEGSVFVTSFEVPPRGDVVGIRFESQGEFAGIESLSILARPGTTLVEMDGLAEQLRGVLSRDAIVRTR